MEYSLRGDSCRKVGGGLGRCLQRGAASGYVSKVLASYCKSLVGKCEQRLRPTFKVLRIAKGSSSNAVRLRRIMMKSFVSITAAGTHAGIPHCHLLGRWAMPAEGLAWRI